MFEKSDEQLAVRALSGNKRAWLKLVKRFEKPVYNYALRLVRNPDDALDMMQEIFLAVFRNLESYRGEGPFRAWLFKIANYRCIEFHRRKRPFLSLDDAPAPEVNNPLDCPEGNTLGWQQGNQLVNAMGELPVNQRTVVELKLFQQFTFEQIANQLGVSTNTVKSRFYSAMSSLKDKLEVAHVA